MSLQEATRVLSRGLPAGTSLISIGDPDGPASGHPLPPKEWETLNIDFADVTSPGDPGAITDSQALKLVRFLESWEAEPGRGLYVHCVAGRSRSQAIVRYVKSRWDHPWETCPWNPDDTPNYYVLGKLRENDKTM